MLDELRQRLQSLQKTAGIDEAPGILPFGIPALDDALGGGLARGALHEISAAGEAHLAAATGFALGMAAHSSRTNNSVIPGQSPETEGRRRLSPESITPAADYGFRVRGQAPASRNDEERIRRGKALIWIAEDMALIESGAPHGPGLDPFGLAPERLLSVAVSHRRDLMWAMEEALRCRAIGAVIGEVRDGALDAIGVRRLSLAAMQSGALALLLRARPQDDASTAATRWIVGAAPSSVIPGRRETANPESITPAAAYGFRARPPLPFGLQRASRNDEERQFGPGFPRFAATLVRNRRGPTGSWILEWRDTDERFVLATHAQPVAATPRHRPRQKVA